MTGVIGRTVSGGTR